VSLVYNDKKDESHKSSILGIHDEMEGLKNLKSKYGIYLVFGNHDFMCGEDQVMKVLKEYPHV
jgi:predicted MPP superfamily phosphohydrolase